MGKSCKKPLWECLRELSAVVRGTVPAETVIRKVIDAAGRYIAPGMPDGHIHGESSMLSVGEYARAVIPHGTAGIYYDPHEICNWGWTA